MKAIITTLTVLCGIALQAQSPSAISYQAVARDGNGQVLANGNLTVRFTLKQGGATGTIVYQETHTLATNGFGLFTAAIGLGTPASGTFGNVNWGNAAHFVQVEVNAGTGYLDMGTTQLLSVPYALYAKEAGNGGGTTYQAGSGIDITGNTISNTAPNQPVTLTGSGATQVSGTYPAFTISSTDSDNQTLSISGSNLSISGGNTITLPPGGTITGVTAGTGLTGGGTNGTVTLNAQTTSPLWNAGQLQGRTLAGTAPASGQVLKWNGSAWAPDVDVTTTDTSHWDKTGNNVYVTHDSVGIGTAQPAAGLHLVAGRNALAGASLQGQGSKLIWLSNKSALRAGYVSGNAWNTDSIGMYTTAFGANARAIGLNAVAIGVETKATGNASVALGDGAMAQGNSSFASGRNTVASGQYASAFGISTVASGNASVAGGWLSVASGLVATAWGFDTKATADYATTSGERTTASATNATAFGYRTLASGIASFAAGNTTVASGVNSVAMGGFNTAAGDNGVAMGLSSEATGHQSTAIGTFNKAQGAYSTSLGHQSTASGTESTSIGSFTTASGNQSTAIGRGATATGSSAISIGYITTASGFYATAFGANTLAKSAYETALGRFNNDYTPAQTSGWATSDRLFVVGNGTSNANRSNAFTIFKNGITLIGNQITTPTDRLQIEADSAENALRIRINGFTKLRVNSNGGVSIGTALNSPANGLVVAGPAQPASNGIYNLGASTNRWNTVYAVNGTINTSDATEKEGISDLLPGMDAVMKLRPVSYTWKDEAIDRKQIHFGFLAQDLLEILPELVATHEWKEGPESSTMEWVPVEKLGVNYSELIPVLTNALQEQHRMMDAQQQALERLSIRLAELEAIIGQAGR